MNILFTNNQPMNPQYGGIERVTDILAKAMVKGGHAVYYFTFKCSSSAILDYDFPAEVHMLPCKNINHPKNTQVYRHFLEEKGIDVIIHQRGLLPEANFFLQEIPSNIHVISVMHSKPFGYWDAYWNTLFANRYGVTNIIKCIIKSIILPYLLCVGKRIEYNKLKKQYEWVALKSDKVVVLSKQYKNILCQRCCVKEQDIVAIPNPNTYEEIKQGSKQKEVLYVGRLTAWDKNVMDIIKIWAKIEPLHPDWKLIIVGDGEQAKPIRRKIQLYGLKHIQLVGKQAPRSYYENAKILLLVSNYEGFPMCVTEGMQHGVVPVVMNTFCASDIIEDGINGCIIPPHDKDKMIQMLDQLMKDEKKLQIMSLQAQEEVKQFNQTKIVKQWFQLLSQYTM